MRISLFAAAVLATGVASATGTGPTDLVVTVESNDSTSIQAGETIGFTVMAANAGPTAAMGAHVRAAFPAVMGDVVWTSEASPGVACPPSGKGDISLVVDLPVGAVVVFTGRGAAEVEGVATATASIVAADGQADVDPTNNEMSADTTVDPAPPVFGEASPGTVGCAVGGGRGGSCLGLFLVGLFILRTSRRS